MRHSDINLTMQTYTDPQLFDLHGAIESMPTLCNEIDTEALRATGTNDTAPRDPDGILSAKSVVPIVVPATGITSHLGSKADIIKANRLPCLPEINMAETAALGVLGTVCHQLSGGIKKAGDGNRTHVISLEGWGFTIKLRPHHGLLIFRDSQ
jgi:hypothetical protein